MIIDLYVTCTDALYVLHVYNVLLSLLFLFLSLPLSLSSYTPLMEAAREGHEDVVQLLVEHGILLLHYNIF